MNGYFFFRRIVKARHPGRGKSRKISDQNASQIQQYVIGSSRQRDAGNPKGIGTDAVIRLSGATESAADTGTDKRLAQRQGNPVDQRFTDTQHANGKRT